MKGTISPRLRRRMKNKKKPAPTKADLLLLAVNAVPDTWLDSLLTGPDAAVGPPPYGCPDIERLCKAIRERIRTAFGERVDSEVKP